MDLQPMASYGICEVSIPPVHKLGDMERPSIWRLELVEDVQRHIVITSRQVSASEASFKKQLSQAFGESGSEAFLFIHGYNVSFDDAVRRTAQLFHDLQFDGVPILFSWPGENAWWRYASAEDATDSSARFLEQFIADVLGGNELTAVNVIAHSLGTRVLTRALERLALRNSPAAFANIVMAAPDINVADFDAVTEALAASARRSTIYSSSGDTALLISKAFHSYPRIGEAPPQRVSARIDTIDASAIKQDLLGHSYFSNSVTVMKDIFLLVKEGLPPSRRFLRSRSLRSGPYWVLPADSR